MTFLFGSFFPTYQVYANSNKYLKFEKVQNVAHYNEDLVERLANSKTFESFYYSLFILGTAANYNLSIMPEKQSKETIAKLETIKNSKDSNLNDACSALGFKIDKLAVEKINELQVKFKSEFPDLALLDQEQREQIINKAVVLGNLNEKVTLYADSKSCLKSASREQGNCIANGQWFRSMTATCAAVCYFAALSCAIGIAAATAGTGIAAAFVALTTLAGGCAVVCLTAFVVSVSETVERKCSAGYLTDLQICALLYGTPASGNAQ